jgi:hypothetical protein
MELPRSHDPGPRRSAAPIGHALIAFLAALSALPLHAQTKHAVFVGIDDYIEFEDEPGGDLLGAERDVRLMKDVLIERWGLDEANTTTLLGRAATKQAIRDAITVWLAARARPGDLAIFYFAGHGSQVFDLDGDEPDGLDETLAPADVLPLSSANDIRDDELRDWLATVRTDVVVILDSCHSGTATRAGSDFRTRSLDRALPPEDGTEPEVVRQRYDPESMADGATTILELAAAAPNESALEGPFTEGPAGAEHGGAFTHYLVAELRATPPTATYEDVMRAVARRLEDEEIAQSPRVTGEGVAPLFTVAPGGRR